MTSWRVEVTNGGFVWYLRGTTWSSDPARAAQYATEEQARAALLRAKPFTKPALIKAANFVECEGEP